MKTVYVVGAKKWCGPSTVNMFLASGWKVVGDEILLDKGQNDVDLVVFTGGADISPHLYGEENISSSFDPIRDQFELDVFYSLKDETKKAGICRGGQLLNVLNGGKLIQHHGHMGGYKDVYGFVDLPKPTTGYIGKVDACHHQGILCPEQKDAQPLMWIDWNEYKEGTVDPGHNWPVYACTFPNTLCVQWHPEWGHSQSKQIFFDLLDKHIYPVKEAA